MSSAVSGAGMTRACLATGVTGGVPVLVLVVVIAVGGVAVPFVLVVDVVAVRDGLMPAACPVSLLVAGMGQGGQWMAVVVVRALLAGRGCRDVVDMSLALHARRPPPAPDPL